MFNYVSYCDCTWSCLTSGSDIPPQDVTLVMNYHLQHSLKKIYKKKSTHYQKGSSGAAHLCLGFSVRGWRLNPNAKVHKAEAAATTAGQASLGSKRSGPAHLLTLWHPASDEPNRRTLIGKDSGIRTDVTPLPSMQKTSDTSASRKRKGFSNSFLFPFAA